MIMGYMYRRANDNMYEISTKLKEDFNKSDHSQVYMYVVTLLLQECFLSIFYFVLKLNVYFEVTHMFRH